MTWTAPLDERHRRFRAQRRRIESGGDPPFPYRQAEHEQGGDREVGNSPRCFIRTPSPVTSTHRDLPSHVEIEAGESGLDHPIYAKCEDVESVSERRLVDRLGVVGPEALFEVGRALRNLLEL